MRGYRFLCDPAQRRGFSKTHTGGDKANLSDFAFCFQSYSTQIPSLQTRPRGEQRNYVPEFILKSTHWQLQAKLTKQTKKGSQKQTWIYVLGSPLDAFITYWHVR